MTNRYFQLSDKEKRTFHLKLVLISILLILTIAILTILIAPQVALINIIVIAIIISIIAPFFDIPTLIEKGKLKYYSLFLLTEEEKNKTIKIHGGTLFDYYFVFQKNMTAQERRKIVLLEYLKGLQKLVETTNDDVNIQGTSYIINERTANKVGLKKVETNGIQKLILLFNYINIMLSISIVKKTIVFPHLGKIKTFEGKISDIKQKGIFIHKLIEKLEKNSSTKANDNHKD